MSGCPTLQELTLLLNGLLDRFAEEQLEVHVETCPHCQHRLEEMVRGVSVRNNHSCRVW